jgi:hypothetical protein
VIALVGGRVRVLGTHRQVRALTAL